MARNFRIADIVEIAQSDGWYITQLTDTHVHYRHARKPGTVILRTDWLAELEPSEVTSYLRLMQLDPSSRSCSCRHDVACR